MIYIYKNRTYYCIASSICSYNFSRTDDFLHFFELLLNRFPLQPLKRRKNEKSFLVLMIWIIIFQKKNRKLNHKKIPHPAYQHHITLEPVYMSYNPPTFFWFSLLLYLTYILYWKFSCKSSFLPNYTLTKKQFYHTNRKETSGRATTKLLSFLAVLFQNLIHF